MGDGTPLPRMARVLPLRLMLNTAKESGRFGQAQSSAHLTFVVSFVVAGGKDRHFECHRSVRWSGVCLGTGESAYLSPPAAHGCQEFFSVPEELSLSSLLYSRQTRSCYHELSIR